MSASVSSSDEGCQIPQFDARPEAVLGAHGRVDFVVSDSSDDSRRRRSRLPTSTPPVAFEGLTTPSKRPPSPLTSQFQPSTKELGRDWMPPVGREDDSDSDTNTNERKRHTKLQNRNKRDRVEGEDESEEDDEDEDEVMDLQQENRKLEERCALLGRKADALEAALAAERMLHQDSVQLRAKTVKCTKCRDHDKALDRLRQEHATTATTAAAAAANLHTKLSSANDENKQLRSTLAVTRDSEASMRREMVCNKIVKPFHISHIRSVSTTVRRHSNARSKRCGENGARRPSTPSFLRTFSSVSSTLRHATAAIVGSRMRPQRLLLRYAHHPFSPLLTPTHSNAPHPPRLWTVSSSTRLQRS